MISPGSSGTKVGIKKNATSLYDSSVAQKMFTVNKLQASHCPVHIKAQLRVYNEIYNEALTAAETVSSVGPSTGTKISPVMEIPQEYREAMWKA